MVQATITGNFSPEYEAELAHYVSVRRSAVAAGLHPLSEDALICELQDTDVYIPGYEMLTPRVVRSSPRLALVASIRGGPRANIDTAACTTAGVPVIYTPGRTDYAASEYVFALIMSLARPVCKADRQMRQGILAQTSMTTGGKHSAPPNGNFAEPDIIWPYDPGSVAFAAHLSLFGTELFDKTLGIIGFGRIGRNVARIARGFGMRILVHDPFVDGAIVADHGGQAVDLMLLLSSAHYVTLHARVTASSRMMIGREQLRAMRPTACLINTARMALIDEEALIEALREGWFRAAALDVYNQEPLPLDHPLFTIDPERVILTPHLAGSTKEVEVHHSRWVVAEVLRYLRGERPRAIYDAKVFDTPSYRERGARLFGVLQQENREPLAS